MKLPSSLTSEGILIANLWSLCEKWRSRDGSLMREEIEVRNEIDDHISRVKNNGIDAIYGIPYTGLKQKQVPDSKGRSTVRRHVE